jgi:outer membrane receptor protein involved in Fe transport
MEGLALPFTPKWEMVLNAEYSFPVKANLDAFVLGNTKYQTLSYTHLGETPATSVAPYALTDLQAGFKSSNGNWRAYVWGRNVFDRYYWYSTSRLIDSTGRMTGMPATFGVGFSGHF